VDGAAKKIVKSKNTDTKQKFKSTQNSTQPTPFWAKKISPIRRGALHSAVYKNVG
jgi:hypothetical protein